MDIAYRDKKVVSVFVHFSCAASPEVPGMQERLPIIKKELKVTAKDVLLRSAA
jgi:hypothetical protein